MRNSGFSHYIAWTLRVLLVFLFNLAGIMKITSHPFELHAFAHFGYDLWFMYFIGVLELAGAFALLIPRFTMPTATVLGAILLGALGSHFRVGDPVLAMLPATVAMAMLISLVAYHRRTAADTATSDSAQAYH